MDKEIIHETHRTRLIAAGAPVMILAAGLFAFLSRSRRTNWTPTPFGTPPAPSRQTAPDGVVRILAWARKRREGRRGRCHSSRCRLGSWAPFTPAPHGAIGMGEPVRI